MTNLNDLQKSRNEGHGKSEQVQSRRNRIIEQFSKQKAEDPLIRFWMERKKRGVNVTRQVRMKEEN
jgi:hypothetical protein